MQHLSQSLVRKSCSVRLSRTVSRQPNASATFASPLLFIPRDPGHGRLRGSQKLPPYSTSPSFCLTAHARVTGSKVNGQPWRGRRRADAVPRRPSPRAAHARPAVSVSSPSPTSHRPRRGLARPFPISCVARGLAGKRKCILRPTRHRTHRYRTTSCLRCTRRSMAMPRAQCTSSCQPSGTTRIWPVATFQQCNVQACSAGGGGSHRPHRHRRTCAGPAGGCTSGTGCSTRYRRILPPLPRPGGFLVVYYHHGHGRPTTCSYSRTACRDRQCTAQPSR